MPSLTSAPPRATWHLDRARELEHMGVPETARHELARAVDAAAGDYPAMRTALARLARCELRCHRPFDSYRAWMQLVELADHEQDPATAGHAHERAALVALTRLAEPRSAYRHLRAARASYVAAGLDDAADRCEARAASARRRLGEPQHDLCRRWARSVADRVVRLAQVPPHGDVLVRGGRPHELAVALVAGFRTAHVEILDPDERVVARLADAVTALGAWDRVRVRVGVSEDDPASGWMDAVVDLGGGLGARDRSLAARRELTIGGRLIELRPVESGREGPGDGDRGDLADSWIEPVPRAVSPARAWLHWRVRRFT